MEPGDAFLALADVSPAPTWHAGADGGWTHSNRAWQRVTGQSAEQSRGDGWRRAIAEPDRAYLVQRHEIAVREVRAFESDVRLRRPDGRLSWFRFAFGPRVDAHGRAIGFVGTAVDITHVEWRSSADLGTASHTVPFEWDAGADRLSLGASPFLGHDAARVVTLADWLALVQTDDRAVLESALRRPASGSTNLRIDARFVDANGDAVPVRMQCVVIGAADGAPRGAFGTLADLRRERDRRWWTETQAAILDRLSESVTVIDDVGRIVYANRAMEADFGYAPDELLGLHVGALTAEDPIRRRERVAAMRAAAERRLHWEGEVGHRRKDGTTFLSHAVVAPYEVDGRRWWVTVRRNVTELRRLERTVLETSHRERHRVATELHEGLAQTLAGLALALRSVQRDVGRDLPDLTERIGAVLASLQDATASCRSYAEDLSLSTLGREGLTNGLHHAARRMEVQHGLTCRTRLDPAVALAIPAIAAPELCRIAQEALENVARHAQTRTCLLSLQDQGGVADLCIADDGVGFGAAAFDGPGLGLKLMRYRAAQVGARLVIDAAPGRGTRVHCRLGLLSH
jgi:PAS domain S-box-containing protein